MNTKGALTIAIILSAASLVSAQTNTFPDSGDVGIGTLSPNAELEIRKANDNADLHINAVGSGVFPLIRWQKDDISKWGLIGEYPSSGKLTFYNYANFTSTMVLQNNGNVGIGTTAPGAGLEVNRGSTNDLALSLTSSGPGWGSGLQFENTGGGGRKYGIYADNGQDNRWHFVDQTALKNRIVINKYGNVGIGVDWPGTTYRLSVDGSIRAKEVIVETGWSDFVFEDGYELRSLNEVESHIEKYGHLPDVPSAREVQSEGLSVGEAQKLMMQKIEELTLYMIEQDKRIEAQQEESAIQQALILKQQEQIERFLENAE